MLCGTEVIKSLMILSGLVWIFGLSLSWCAITEFVLSAKLEQANFRGQLHKFPRVAWKVESFHRWAWLLMKQNCNTN